ncbi:DUF4345 domain-containing protein [Sphingobium boeckii]|uniref:DUF4345 domain-containing protein n=1 Tax=Sphingobium boeckii TaxID=1082345 RepID=A0A7W9ECX6_9SPHN|nr:DUF4345 domain-containing protein [Sphingobium boeckii]MBB5684527.1 hypothetical protein [Sphingobium boeckii]
MTGLAAERRLLQLIVALACIVPLMTGGMSVIEGPGWLHGVGPHPPTDLDSHFRYVSGIFLALGLAFASCVPRIEISGPRFRLLSFMVMTGGLARAWSLVEVGAPSRGHLLGLCMELGVVPLLMLWQARFARRYAAAG